MHVHQDEDELFYVVQGTYEITCGEQVIEADAGDFAHLPRGIAHRYRNVGDGEGILMNTMTPGGFEKFLEEVDQLPKNAPLDKSKVTEITAG
jgi:quercetin dioxygenase-like cupin family protein